MAKWRALHASITTDGKVNRMSEFAQLLYDRMMVKANDWGVITGDSFELKGETVPLLSRNFQELDDAMQEMVDQDLVWQYEPEGYGPLVQIKKFDDHQPKSLISKRSVPKLPLHPAWQPLPDDDRSIQLLESLETSRKRMPRVDKSRVDKSRQDKSSPKGEKTKRKKPNTPHQRTVAGYVERISKGYSKRYPGEFAGDMKAIKHLLERGHSEETILACYDDTKSDHFWASKHLPMRTIDKNIDDWVKSGGKRGTDKRRDREDADPLGFNADAARIQAEYDAGKR